VWYSHPSCLTATREAPPLAQAAIGVLVPNIIEGLKASQIATQSAVCAIGHLSPDVPVPSVDCVGVCRTDRR